jgi:hypothetical protein
METGAGAGEAVGVAAGREGTGRGVPGTFRAWVAVERGCAAGRCRRAGFSTRVPVRICRCGGATVCCAPLMPVQRVANTNIRLGNRILKVVASGALKQFYS